MAWTYDPRTDVLTVTYGRRDSSLTRSIESHGAVLDVDGHGQTVRVRFPDASRLCPRSVLQDLNGPPSPRDDLYSLNEAAVALGVKPYALRHEVLSGGMPATQLYGDWYFRSHVITFYREMLTMRLQVIARVATDRPASA
jgi:hypothetical protein